MVSEQQKRRYANVLLKCGIQLQPHQPVCIEASEKAADFVEIVKEEAVHAGSDVLVIWQEEEPDMAAVENFVSRMAGFIGLESPGVESDEKSDGEGMKKESSADLASVRNLFRSKGRNGGQTLACVPCESWAKLVFPDLPEKKGLEKLWTEVLSCTYSDTEDPMKAWREYTEAVTARKEKLDARKYQEFRYQGSGTDLTIRPADGDFWKGGCVKTPGRISIPNIPTQEVFLSPHKYSAEGRLAATMPLNFHGSLIEGIELNLEGGRIVSCTAARNQELLEQITATDEGSHYLGEMALVDQRNPIASCGLLFYTTLYDENASCHVAIGNTIGPPFDSEEKVRRGYNSSAVHLDFMVGSKELSIRGRRSDGVWEDVLSEGRLLI